MNSGHPKSSRRQTVAIAKLHFSDQFICLSVIALMAAFFFMYGLPRTTLTYELPAAPHFKLSPAETQPQEFRALVTLAKTDAAEAATEAGMSATALLDRWQPYIEEASKRFAVPEKWIRAVIRIESGGRTALSGQPITSNAGAMGVMQLMPGTYGEMRTRHGLGPNPYVARDNILAGTAYLQILYKKYGFPSLFAAYNAGPGRLEAHLRRGHALPAETRAYVGSALKVVGKVVGKEKNQTPRRFRKA